MKFYPGNNSKVIYKCLTRGRALNFIYCHYCSFFHLDNQCLPIDRKVSLLRLRTASRILNKCFLGVYNQESLARDSETQVVVWNEAVQFGSLAGRGCQP